ncbi:MAG: tetratricopeptide repeat protein [bacterium]|nr:tetratricopeptide repeat protein [bacterium]
MRKTSNVLLVLVVFLFSGCAVHNSVQKTKKQINDIDNSTKRIEGKVDSLSKEEINAISSTRADIGTKLSELGDRTEKIENRINELQELYKKKTPNVNDTTRKSSSEIYNIAYTDFTKGNYELAINGFRKFLSDFSDADNAQYWLGECYYALEDYPSSLQAFKNITLNYPFSKKVPVALYKIISISKTTNDTLTAKEYLKKLTDIYPNSAEAKLAKEMLADTTKKK